jgi:hypothetical protein
MGLLEIKRRGYDWILPGLALNISKSGVGFSVGGRGFHAGIDSKGRRYTSASLPGTGISWRQYQKAKPHHALTPHVAPRITPPEGDHQLSPCGEVPRRSRRMTHLCSVRLTHTKNSVFARCSA